MTPKKRVLVVEDDPSLIRVLRDNLLFEGFDVECVSDADAAMARASDFRPDLIMLDVLLPGTNGFELAELLRRKGKAPFLFLTARTQKADKLRGLNLGADDYITKPFDLEELVARVRAILRRARPAAEELILGSIRVNFASHVARRGRTDLRLTHRELELLQYLAERPGQVVPRDELLRAVWGYAQTPFTRSVDNAIARLRKKIEIDRASPAFYSHRSRRWLLPDPGWREGTGKALTHLATSPGQSATDTSSLRHEDRAAPSPTHDGAVGKMMLSELHAWVHEIAQLTEPAGVTLDRWINRASGRLDSAVCRSRRTHRTQPGPSARLLSSWNGSRRRRSNRAPHVCQHRTSSRRRPYEQLVVTRRGHGPSIAPFRGCMAGRPLYVVPFLMGPAESRFARAGVQLTDSRYVALSLRLMTNVGLDAIDHMVRRREFARCIHSVGDRSPIRRMVVHFPHTDSVWAIGSGYGGNAVLAKKGMALRLASCWGRREGWLAEHMAVIGVEDPKGRVRYIAGAFPSASGKTNLAMLTPPPSMPGWKVWTVGDDLAWLRPGPNGRLWAVSPESGFFGVLPGTNRVTNPVATEMIRRNTLYTNVALRPDGTPWWEGHDDPAPSVALDWQGEPWSAGRHHIGRAVECAVHGRRP